jgi:hypothetical protein
MARRSNSFFRSPRSVETRRPMQFYLLPAYSLRSLSRVLAQWGTFPSKLPRPVETRRLMQF